MTKNEYLEDKKRYRDALRAMKLSGRSAYDLWKEIRSAVIKNSEEQHWRPSEAAVAISEHFEAMQIVYGKATMRKADEQAKKEQPWNPLGRTG